MSFCPVYTSQDWINLEKVQGKAIAHILWDKYQGNVPQEYFKDKATEEETIIKHLNKVNNLLEDSTLSDLVSSAFTLIQNNNQTSPELFHSIIKNIIGQNELETIEQELVKKYGDPSQSIKFYKKDPKYKDRTDTTLKLLWIQEKLRLDFMNFYNTPLGRKEDSNYPKTTEIYNRLKALVDANSYKSFLETIDDIISTDTSFKEDSIGESEESQAIDEVFDITSMNIEGRIKGYTSTMKLSRAKSLADLFKAQILSDLELGVTKVSEKKVNEIFHNLFVKYKKRAIQLSLRLKQLQDSGDIESQEFKDIQKKLTHLAPLIDSGKYNVQESQKLIKADVISILKNQGFKFPRGLQIDSIEIISYNSEELDNLEDAETDMSGGGEVTKGFGDSTNISNFSRASTRMKMYLGSLKKLDKEGNPIEDEAGDHVYMNMNSMFYFVEQNLVDHYSIEEMIETLQDLTDLVPELQKLVDNLTDIGLYNSQEDLDRFRNEFKTTFTNQQYKYLMALTKKSEGAQMVDIINPNRRDLVNTIKQEWHSNVMSKTNDTIGIFDKEWSIRNNEKSNKLEEEWNSVLTSVSYDHEVSKEFIDKVLQKMGVNLGPKTLDKLYADNFNPESTNEPKNNTIIKHITGMLKALNSESKDSKLQSNYNKSLTFFAKQKANSELSLYTLSFNDVENKNIFTIQLPSFISELMKNINTTDETKWQQLLSDLRRDPMYASSSFLKYLEDRQGFRENLFRMFIMDGLKRTGFGKGTKFIKLTARDFIFTDIAFYNNAKANKDKEIGADTSKHIFVTQADKNLQTIFEMPKRSISINNDGKIKAIDQTVIKDSLAIIQGELARIVQATQDRIPYDMASAIEDETKRNEAKQEATKQLVGHYHYKVNKNRPFNGDFNGEAYRFHSFGNLNKIVIIPSTGEGVKDVTLYDKLIQTVLEGKSVEETVEAYSQELIDAIRDKFNSDVEAQLVKLEKEGLIKRSVEGTYSNVLLPAGFLKSKEDLDQEIDEDEKIKDYNIRKAVAGYTTNKFINNWELGLLFNGDPAWYKANDLVKRAYQSNSSISKGDTSGTLKVAVFEDLNFSKERGNSPELYNQLKLASDIQVKNGYLTKKEQEEILAKFEESNIADAFSAITPQAWMREKISRGQDSPEIVNAYEIAEGLKEYTPEEYNEAQGVLAGDKPFAYGVIWNPNLNKYVPVQYKTFLVPLFKTFIKDNPFLTKKREEMEEAGVDLLVAESTLKAFLPYRAHITDKVTTSFEMPRSILGIQVSNVQHLVDEKNDALRQLKMHAYGWIQEDKVYFGNQSGTSLYQELDALEAANIKQATKKVDQLVNSKDGEFLIDLAEGLTARGASEGTKDLFKVENNQFVYPLAIGGHARQAQYMIASVYTNNIAKQEFQGGSAVSTPSLGFTFKEAIDQQETALKDPRLAAVKSQLGWSIDEEGRVIAECAMPAWNDAFFIKDEKGNKIGLKDISEIPEDLLTFPAYRIPNEGAHSTPIIKVTRLMDPTLGNFMLLPNDIVTLLGEDFDFDKRYFIYKHFFLNKEGQFVIPQYSSETTELATQKRFDLYTKREDRERSITLKKAVSILSGPQLAKLGAELRAKVLTYDQFKKQTVAEQNTKEARDNRIIDIYKEVLTSPNTFKTMWNPSGFRAFEEAKKKYSLKMRAFGISQETTDAFFDALSQALIKVRNATGRDLKGMAANHVTAHALFTKLKPFISKKFALRIDNKVYDNLSEITDEKGNYIGDKLGEALAAVLDDLKNPLLELLGINLVTVDTFSLMLHSGVDFNTTFGLLTNPGIRTTVSRLINNSSNVKESTEGWITLNNIVYELQSNANTFRKVFLNIADKSGMQKVLPSGLIGDGETNYDQLKNSIERFTTPSILSNRGVKEEITTKEGKTFTNNHNWDLEKLETFYFTHKDKIDELLKVKTEDGFKKFINKYKLSEDVSSYDLQKTEIPFNIVTAYSYIINNLRVNKAFKSYNETSKDLTSRHIKILTANKELGPDVEALFELKTLKEGITDDRRPVIMTGSLEHLDGLYEAIDSELEFLTKEFPYLTPFYKQVKDIYIQTQVKLVNDEDISQDQKLLFLRKDIRDKVNYFIDLITKLENPNLQELKDPKGLNDLLTRTVKKYEEIIKLKNRKEHGLVAENAFFANITKEKKKQFAYPLIQLRNTKLDVTVKNAVEDSILEMFYNPKYKEFVIDLAKYSLAYEGSGGGYAGFINLIHPKIFAEIGLGPTYRQWQAKTNKATSAWDFTDQEEYDHIIDQLIRNNAGTFTKIVDVKVGSRIKAEDGSVQFIIDSEKVSSDYRVEENNLKIGTITSAGSQESSEDIEWGDDVNAKATSVYAKYIRVKNKNKEELYKLVSDNMDLIKTYERISYLGGKGYLVEIKNQGDNSESIIPENNYKKESKRTEDYKPQTEEEKQAEKLREEENLRDHNEQLREMGLMPVDEQRQYNTDPDDNKSVYSENEKYLMEQGYDEEGIESLREQGSIESEVAFFKNAAKKTNTSTEDTGGIESCD